MHVDVCVIGGGVVGTSVCRELAVRGFSVLLLDRGNIGGGVSAGNTGITCTLLDIADASLERHCLQRSIPLNLATYRDLGIPHVPSGTLYVAWSLHELQELRNLFHRAGVNEGAQLLDKDALQREEPNLADAFGALLIPSEIVVDPGLVPLAYVGDAIRRGALVLESSQLVNCRRKGAAWELAISRSNGQAASEFFSAEHVVNCAGLYADQVQAMLANVPVQALAFKPRRGDYIVMRQPGDQRRAAPLRRPIGTVPTSTARGVYVWPTVHGDVACGPTNVEQEDKDLPGINSSTLAELEAIAVKVCPELSTWEVAGCYSGLRPALEPSTWGMDYHISTSQECWTTVAGMRSTGLSASLGIASTVVDRISMSLSRTSSRVASKVPLGPVLPRLSELAREFVSKADGTIDLGGRRFQVSHPITCIGLAGHLNFHPSTSRNSSQGASYGSRAWVRHGAGGARHFSIAAGACTGRFATAKLKAALGCLRRV
eukprot:TRINITY_DN79837_c0_g1_i1.p1 TRINITY_DN79837_c0_g1~~TRINITY_DN79837_c0_g1_i1.p1  ORF type:complete len:487 (+),score=67.40 TRINITY_DN79837_c0_g1_i1:110-1570(+)